MNMIPKKIYVREPDTMMSKNLGLSQWFYNSKYTFCGTAYFTFKEYS